MKHLKFPRGINLLRLSIAFVVAAICGVSHAGAAVSILAVSATALVNPFTLLLVGMANQPYIAGSTKAQIIAASPDGEEIKWEMELVQSAFQTSAFSDNMVGKLGSGKPCVEHTSTKTVAGQSIVISTLDSLGAPLVQGNAVRVGQEEQIKPGDFLLKTSLGFFPVGIDNTGLTQTVVGQQWDNATKGLLARRLSKQQNDDRLTCLKHTATSDNTVYAGAKTIDTLGTSDKFGTSLIVRAAGFAKDLGANPMNARPNQENPSAQPPPINRYMQFLTDVGARPIKQDALYLQGLSYAQDRGDKNGLFTGEYSDWDNNIVYPWVNVRHGGYGSIGSSLQPEALLGTAIVAKGTSTDLSAGLTGGGSNTAATITPLRNYFEHFSRFTYTPINGVTSSYAPRASVGYFIVINKSDSKIAFFSYTTNGGNTLTGLTRLGSTIAGNYNTTVGSVSWNTTAAPAQGYTTVADNNGFQGLTEGLLDVGSLVIETNAKGVPLCWGLCLGEMALVEGYGKIPINNGASFKSMVNRVDYNAPYNQAFGRGLEVAWGCAAFKRPDGITPNYVLEVMAREVPGVPVIA